VGEPSHGAEECAGVDGLPEVRLVARSGGYGDVVAERERGDGRRGNAASELIELGAPAEEVLPDIERMLKTEDHRSALAGAGWAAYHLGAAAKPLLPLLRAAAQKVDKDIVSIFEQAIAHVEKEKAEPVPEAEARRRAVIRKEIREFVAGLKAKESK